MTKMLYDGCTGIYKLEIILTLGA